MFRSIVFRTNPGIQTAISGDFAAFLLLVAAVLALLASEVWLVFLEFEVAAVTVSAILLLGSSS